MSVIAIHGPTGSGKTEVAVELARMLGTEVVNADPAQCYDGLPILTNKPGPEHDAVAPHRLVGIWPLMYTATVAAYALEAHREIDALVTGHGWAVVTSGSGLYLQAAIAHLAFGDGSEPDPAIRARIAHRYDAEGGEVLVRELERIDAPAAQRIHPNDRKRVIRALEAVEEGSSIAPYGASLWDAPHRIPTTVFGLVIERAVAHERINVRTSHMFERGVVAEVEAVVGPGASRLDEALSPTARQLHGLQDCVSAITGEIDLDEAQRRMATRTRQYVRRQDVWGRRWPGLLPVEVDLDAGGAGRVARLLLERVTHD